MSREPVLLVAAGGLARETLVAINAGSDLQATGMMDDDQALHGTLVSGGLRVFGPLTAIVDYPNMRVVVCVGSSVARSSVVDKLAEMGVGRDRFATVIHPSISVPPGSAIGAGTVLLAQVALTAPVVIGANVVVMPNVTITHDNVIDDCATLCAGVSLGGWVRVGSRAYLGMNASVRERVSIGVDSILGMGSVLIENQPAGETWVGIPARPMRARERVLRG